MGSLDNFPYQALLNGINDIWVLKEIPSEHDAIIDNLKGDPGYVPDPRASAAFFNNALRKDADNNVITAGQPLNDDGVYYTIDNNSPGLFVCSVLNADNEPLGVGTLNNITVFPNNKGSVSYNIYNFYVVVDDTTETLTVKACGVAVRYIGTYEGESVSSVIVSPFPQAVVDVFKNIVEIRGLSNFYGIITTQLKYSNGFKITTLPDEVMRNKVPLDGAMSGYWEQSVLPCDLEFSDSYDKNGRYRYIVSAITTYTWADGLQSQAAILSNIFNSYKEIGSDMLRLTVNGEYTNGADLSPVDLDNGLVDGREINFSGGKLKLRYQSTYGASDWYFDLYNANNQVVDTWHLNGTSNPTVNTYIGGAYSAVYNAYLVKYGSKYYVASMIQGGQISDANDNTIRTNEYNMCDVFAIVHEFNTDANQLLENGTETIIDYDPEHIDENSPEASTGDDQTDNYDRESQWRRGEGAGSNEGIRHNGSEIINASDLEKTASDETPHGSSPPESGPNRIITPINSGAIKAFVINDPDVMAAFMGELNSDDFGTLLTKYFSNPMDVFISLHRCITPAITAGESKYLHYGLWTSQHALPVLNQEKYDVFMGYKNLREYCNSFKDYPPFCNYYIYLPYIGIRPMDGKIIAGKEISLYYHIDVLTGDILAELRAYNASSGHDDTIYYWTGNTLAAMPLKSTDYSSMISGLISTVIGVGTAAATGNVLGALPALAGAKGGIHPDISVIGTVTGSTCFCMPSQPYIIREMPQESNKYPENYNRLNGRPSNLGSTIGKSYSATSNRYLIFSEADLPYINNSATSATEDELLELKRLLMEGVYV